MSENRNKFLRWVFCLLLLVIYNHSSQAQMVGAAAMDFKELTYRDNLPKYLLSRKSIVLLSTPRSEEDPRIRSDWKELSRFVHKYFRQMKIDPVAYFYIDDVFSNVEANRIFTEQLAAREIKYVILVDQKRITGKPEPTYQYKITVTPFDDENTFISQGQNAWKIEGQDLTKILVEMNKEIIREEMEMSNYLIPDFPEFFAQADIIQGRRIPSYAMDLKIETLVVPRFQKFIVQDSRAVDQAYLQRVAKFNQEIDRKNRKLEQILSSYSPLKYQLTDEVTALAIYNDGHQFALMRVDGTGEMIKKSLGFETQPKETDYITLKASAVGAEVYPLPVDAVVTKYYVQHVFTKDTYVGLKWDADLTWEESLQNFIFHMKDVLRIK
ncbi:hypothetical protein [Reichenbachiella agariperforans]|nr:hypothetical protein [Reichenbachiella agariperforans]